ncbi:MAG: FAD:protein FMN transferase [Clostridiales bacterium]|nr:FAD:protein FMN transferase [Clostridiales bacterium]
MKKLVSTICAVVIFFACAVPLLGCNAAGYTEFAPVAVFSDDIAFTAKIMGARADYAYSRMKEAIERINREVSATNTSSELYKFNNAQAGEKVEIGRYFDELFMLSKEYYTATDGAFNPAAAPLIELWHVDAQSIADYRQSDGTDGLPGLPTVAQVQDTLEVCDFSAIERTVEGDKVYISKPDARIKLDFGGIAKGYAVDKCVDILDEYEISSALIDISGNAYFYGDYMGGKNESNWNVGIVSPRPRSGDGLVRRGYVCAASLVGGVSAVTSGDYMRYYVRDGVYIPHIIGKDGVPIGVRYDDAAGKWVNTYENVISATVIGKSSAQCDALSTAVCAVGFDEGKALLQNLGLKGLIFSEKRFTIIGDVALYATGDYDGYRAYERV